ncbi:hypothetical protein HMPREF0484_3943 [Klebsiella pneumoniae subsp. rhinoscleromatis ATCC 13884]|uniref:hypothetical protein n=1 Tax=Klebsiella pneumoniae TaxID=573 RepID=UPI0001B76C22|nr:hypothetical protein [Klebsiella pneumoniae]STV63642.1 Uncharacterised protein [Klebsiella pneumoniae subsp. rhinoscleromatis]EEW40013.1 hypothetical protein HMPREF0484_3943 [Klebsiella pneumoniae subsp. rhinoscleromatis ATCC 13884]STT66207.1 Uncharacterised protein [Klebsiella pneumoniae]STT68628.1 Uncharacterised protein [Klebsiella pneumoniae]STU07415.1 Uncharacterised protein [Klebsiella pneumoniae]
MKTNTTNHPNIISAMEFTNNVCALLVAIELSAEQLDADAIKDASNGIRYLASRAYEELERVKNTEAGK